MASDHRGRGLHAGKRTNQEMASEGAEGADGVKKSAPVYQYGPGERAVEKRLSDSLFGRSKK